MRHAFLFSVLPFQENSITAPNSGAQRRQLDEKGKSKDDLEKQHQFCDGCAFACKGGKVRNKGSTKELDLLCCLLGIQTECRQVQAGCRRKLTKYFNLISVSNDHWKVLLYLDGSGKAAGVGKLSGCLY